MKQRISERVSTRCRQSRITATGAERHSFAFPIVRSARIGGRHRARSRKAAVFPSSTVVHVIERRHRQNFCQVVLHRHGACHRMRTIRPNGHRQGRVRVDRMIPHCDVIYFCCEMRPVDH